jgi:hypothetical protein
MKISIDMASGSSELLSREGAWNEFVDSCSSNPFLLNEFVRRFIERNRPLGWTPFILVLSTNNKIIGISPLMITQKLRVRLAKFLLKPWFSPSLVSNCHNQETCTIYTLEFLFKTLHCQLVDLTLSSEHLVRIFEQVCRAQKIFYCTLPELGHRILPITCSWTEFEKSRGAGFRQRFRRMEKKSASHWGKDYMLRKGKPKTNFRPNSRS